MLKVFAGAGLDVHREVGAGNVEVVFPIASTTEYVSAVDSRDHVAVVASLRPFFQPRAVAVVGASARRGTIGGELFRNVLAGEFAGAAYPVNRNAEPVGGVRAYASIEEIPDEIDLAVICLPGEHVLPAAEEALRAGVRALCVISAGFAELGAEGRARQEHLLALVRAHGVRLLGPNCLGIASASARLNATFAAKPIPPGNIGFSSQSGALGLALLEAAAGRDLGLSAFVSIGNKADVSSNDLLEWWEEDDATDLVLLYLESFGNPRKFARLARRVARLKPILALKSGTTHAGRARRELAHRRPCGLRRRGRRALSPGRRDPCRDARGAARRHVAALVAAAPAGRRVGLLTNAGGLGILCADACEAAGLELPPLSPETESKLRELIAAEASVANPGRHARRRDARELRARAADTARGQPPRRGDRPLRAAGQRRRGRRRRRTGARGRGRADRQARARGADGSGRANAADRTLRLSGVGGPRARACGGARGVAAPAARRDSGTGRRRRAPRS